tara:strand:- start:11693 stop:12181 length:489 start_codon:yes stop_codon:yes gene_type:complete
MTAFSDYLESGLLHHVFRGQDFPKPANVAIALCSGVPRDSDTGVSQYANGGTLPEIPSGNSTGASTGYGRKDLGDPSVLGNSVWTYDSDDHDAGSGLIKNTDTILFGTATQDWGWVSGIAIVDSGDYGTGNMLMYAELSNPRIIYQGDTVKFDVSTLQIKFK